MGDQLEAALTGIRETVDAAANRLETAHAHDEAVAEFVPPRRRFLITRAAAMVPLTRAWRLGVFLLGHDRTLYEVGLLTRAIEPGHPGFQSLSAETRRVHRAAAFAGPFERGEIVNFDCHPIELDAATLTASTGRLFLREGQPMVRWATSSDDRLVRRFDQYLSERVDLLVHPPEGA